MAGTFTTTTRFALRILKGSSLVSDIDEGFQRLAEDVDTKMLGFSEGTHAARPAAAYPNRLYFETDTKLLFRDTGAGWEQQLTTTSLSGGYTNPGAVAANTLYTPSTTRATLVVLSFQTPQVPPTIEMKIMVGGVEVSIYAHPYNENRWGTETFVVPANTTWEAKCVGSNFVIQAKYLFL
jgi:hypothetical protein